MTGTKTICNTSNNTYRPTTFGGVIYDSDFYTELLGVSSTHGNLTSNVYGIRN